MRNQKLIFFIFQPKYMLWVLKNRPITYVVGTQKNRLTETLLLSTKTYVKTDG